MRLFALLLPFLFASAFGQRTVELETFLASGQPTECNDIREVDFRNRTYAIDDLGMGFVELKDGKWEFSPEVIVMDETAALTQVQFCEQSAFVTISWCSYGGGTTCRETTIRFELLQGDLWRMAQITCDAHFMDVAPPDPKVDCEAKTLTIFSADKSMSRDDKRWFRRVYKFSLGFAGEMKLVSEDEVPAQSP